MGGRGSGGARSNSLGRQMKLGNIDPDINHRTIEFGKSMLGFDLVDFEDGDEQWRRFYYMCDMADKWGLRPNIPALGLVMGTSNQRLYEIIHGERTKLQGQEVTSLFRGNVQKMYNFIQLILESNLLEETKNPVKWIFLAKNHFDYTDSRENVIRTVDDKPKLESAEEVAKKYRAMLGKTSDEVIEVQNLAGKSTMKPKRATIKKN